MKPNLAAIKEWRLKHSEFESRKRELDEITDQRDAKRKTYEELRKKRLDEFMEGFNIIRRRLAEMYKMITLGMPSLFFLLNCITIFNGNLPFLKFKTMEMLTLNQMTTLTHSLKEFHFESDLQKKLGSTSIISLEVK